MCSMKEREQLRCYGATDIGKRRANNEDAFVVEHLDEHSFLAVAIDGVGGYEGGEVAAEIAQKEIPAYLKEFTRGERLELLKQAVVSANNAVFEHRRLDVARPNMGCVLTSAIIDAGRKVIDMVHVGDTRLYQFNDGKLVKLSHDHSFVGYCEEIGDLTEEQAMHHPRRNEISRSVGAERHGVNDHGFLEAAEFPLLPNSIFLLCSDGLTDLITSKQIAAILEQPISLEEKTQALIDAANNAGGKDNITVVLVEYRAEEAVIPTVREEIASQSERITYEDVPEKTKQEKGKNNILVPILATICFLFASVCVSLLISLRTKDVRMQKQEEQIVQLSLATVSESNADDSSDLMKKINSYTHAMQNNELDSILQMYADTVRRYINYTNISNERAVELFKQYDKQRNALEKELSVQWDTWTVKRLPNGEISVDFIENVKIVKQDSSEVLYVTHRIVTFNNERKIVSVLEDVLPKSK